MRSELSTFPSGPFPLTLLYVTMSRTLRLCKSNTFEIVFQLCSSVRRVRVLGDFDRWVRRVVGH